jgi:hypothetical protein
VVPTTHRNRIPMNGKIWCKFFIVLGTESQVTEFMRIIMVKMLYITNWLRQPYIP